MSRNRLRSTLAGIAAAALLTTAMAACAPTAQQPPEPSMASSTPTEALDPAELLEQATRNMLEADSKRLTGTATVAGSTQEIEIVYVGDGARGHKVERFSGFESVTDFVKVDGSLYILAGEAYWQWHVGLQDLYLVVNHWVRVAADHPQHSALLVFTDSRTSPWKPVGDLTQEDGEDPSTVVLVDSEGNRFTVSTGDIPYLVRAELTQESELGTATADFTLSDFGEVTETFTVPPGEIVDLQ